MVLSIDRQVFLSLVLLIGIPDRRAGMSGGYIFCRNKILIFALLGRGFLLRFSASPGVGRTMKSAYVLLRSLNKIGLLVGILAILPKISSCSKNFELSCTLVL